MFRKLVLAITITITIASVAATTYAGGNKSTTYKELDSDKDGYISQKEGKAMPILAHNWRAVDVNQDGQLDTSEFTRFEIALEQTKAAREGTPTEK